VDLVDAEDSNPDKLKMSRSSAAGVGRAHKGEIRCVPRSPGWAPAHWWQTHEI
jgi:hypothetical protein